MADVADAGREAIMKIEETERQMILLALAELALSRPGFEDHIRVIVTKFRGEAMFEEFKRANADRVKQSRMPGIFG